MPVRPVGARSGKAQIPLTLSEGELRRLASPAAYEEAAAWEKKKHVLQAALGTDGAGRPYLTGRVLGTWQRADEPVITVEGQTIRSLCTCGTATPAELCRHAVALLLHWTRHPSAFKAVEPAFPDGDLSIDEMEGEDSQTARSRGQETAHGQFARMLSVLQMATLRGIAKQRGVRVTAKTKAELVEQLADALSDPENLQAALARLDRTQSDLLLVTDLLAAAGRAQSTAIVQSYETWRGSGSASRDTASAPEAVSGALALLEHLGLLIPEDRHDAGLPRYLVPISVTAGLGSRPELLPRHQGATQRARPAQPALGLAEVIRVLVDAVARGDVGGTVVAPSADQRQRLPNEWISEQVHIEERAAPRGAAKATRNWQATTTKRVMRVRPMPNPLTVGDQLTLVERTGTSIALLELAVRCLFAAGALRITTGRAAPRLAVNAECVRPLLAGSAIDQLLALINAWLALPDTYELAQLLVTAGSAEPGQLEFRYTIEAYSGWAQMPAGIARLRALLARLIGRLAVEAGEADQKIWYTLDALLDFLWRVAAGLIAEVYPGGYGSRGFVRPGTSTFLDLHVRDDWERVARPVVTAMLTGALHWLGLVETRADDGAPLLFRPRPRAVLLTGRVPAPVAPAAVEPIRFELDAAGRLQATVPPGYPEASVHAIFASWGEMIGGSSLGLRYRLDLAGIYKSFQAGLTGAGLLTHLRNFAGGSLPPPVEALVSQWAGAYGAVRLYDDLTLIEVSDDLLLRELLATSSLAGAIMHTFSPRLAAVDPTQVDDLVAELTRLGHNPRVLESQ